VEALAAEIGNSLVIARCIDLLGGRDVEPKVIFALGGPPARWAVDGGAAGPDYWLRVWALRGLLWVWTDEATAAVLAAMNDEAWRVREMAAKVAARNLVDDALPRLLGLRDDSVPRVRVAATRAIKTLTSSGH
jgi:HEAT repeat protein